MSRNLSRIVANDYTINAGNETIVIKYQLSEGYLYLYGWTISWYQDVIDVNNVPQNMVRFKIRINEEDIMTNPTNVTNNQEYISLGFDKYLTTFRPIAYIENGETIEVIMYNNQSSSQITGRFHLIFGFAEEILVKEDKQK